MPIGLRIVPGAVAVAQLGAVALAVGARGQQAVGVVGHVGHGLVGRAGGSDDARRAVVLVPGQRHDRAARVGELHRTAGGVELVQRGEATRVGDRRLRRAVALRVLVSEAGRVATAVGDRGDALLRAGAVVGDARGVAARVGDGREVEVLAGTLVVKARDALDGRAGRLGQRAQEAAGVVGEAQLAPAVILDLGDAVVIAVADEHRAVGRGRRVDDAGGIGDLDDVLLRAAGAPLQRLVREADDVAVAVLDRRLIAILVEEVGDAVRAGHRPALIGIGVGEAAQMQMHARRRGEGHAVGGLLEDVPRAIGVVERDRAAVALRRDKRVGEARGP